MAVRTGDDGVDGGDGVRSVIHVVVGAVVADAAAAAAATAAASPIRMGYGIRQLSGPKWLRTIQIRVAKGVLNINCILAREILTKFGQTLTRGRSVFQTPTEV